MRRMLGLILTILLGGWGFAPARAERLTLKRAYELALVHNPLLKAARSEVAAARSGVSEARGAFLPRVDLRLVYARTDSPVQVFSYKLAQENFKAEDFYLDRLNHPVDYTNWQTQVVVTQPIFNQGREIIGYRRARIALSQAENYLRAVRQRVLFETERAYLRVLLARERVGVMKEAVRTARENLRVVERRYREGRALKSDLLEAQVFLSRQEKDLAAARHRLEVALSGLSLVLGEPLERRFEPVPVEGVPGPPGDFDKWRCAALRMRPDLKVEEQRVRLARLAVKEARFRFLPSLNLKGIYEKNAEDPLSGGADGDAYTIMAEVNLNLFRGFSDRARLSRAEAEWLAARERLRQYRREVEHQVREAYSRYLTALKEYEVTRRAVAQAEEGLRIIRQRYEAGLALLVELQDAETALKRARLMRLEALYGLRLAESGLRFAAGLMDTKRIDATEACHEKP
ncbi:TolC family protein [Thermosulfurimonas sp. F29]|uniref:TolC family protein n=1 Tax=Thermosulfurimonas sp. F29 TaxID=2867247 RepID=UPI001C835918|nr:TolC family protein [Thermosulfurimonas sp. F29]MBX6422375.1 TolC family protein [Thermosulfurimonas sp. F29]